MNIPKPISPVTHGTQSSSDQTEDARISVWQKLGGGSLSISIFVHLILLIIGVFWIFQIIPEKKPEVDFLPKGGGGGMPSATSETTMKKRATMRTMNAPRVVAKGATANFTLPEPDAATVIASVGALGSNSMAGGLGGSGSGGGKGSGKGTGFGDGMGPGLGGGAGKFNPFGMLDPRNQGLVGTFYDFKRDKDGKPSGSKIDMPEFLELVKDFSKGRTWGPPRRPYYTSPVKLDTRSIFLPCCLDTDAGKAFQSPETGPGMWLVHYTATVASSETGTWRFVGWGDNALVVGINGSIKLDAGDIYEATGRRREPLGPANPLKKPNIMVFAGEWFQLRAEQQFTMDVVIGDQGGVFAAGLMIQKKGEEITKGPNGVPNLPIFRTSDFTPAEQETFKSDWPEAALKGPVFRVKRGSAMPDI